MYQCRSILCESSLEPPRKDGSNECSKHMFLSRNKKNITENDLQKHTLCVKGLVLNKKTKQFTPTGSKRFLSTHCYLENRKRAMGKQCRPRSDATSCGV